MAMAMAEVRSWVAPDETARTMLARIIGRTLPALLPIPPLHRAALRPGNIVEIVGSSGSAKSEILVQAAVTCILPKELDGIKYGGSDGIAMMLDLDCKFDMLRLVQVLQSRIYKAQASQLRHTCNTQQTQEAEVGSKSKTEDQIFLSCLERFYYLQCYSSLEFLAALKAFRWQFKKAVEQHQKTVQLVLIDSIGAFYWLDRSSSSCSMPSDYSHGRSLSLQVVFETVVRELTQLLQSYAFLVLATKSALSSSTKELHVSCLDVTERNDTRKLNIEEKDTYSDRTKGRVLQKPCYKEYMPAVWKGFVTHRVHLQGPITFDKVNCEVPVFCSEWKMPPLSQSDEFVIDDEGIKLVSRN